MTQSFHDLKGTARAALRRYRRSAFKRMRHPKINAKGKPVPLTKADLTEAERLRNLLRNRRIDILGALGITDSPDIERCLKSPWLDGHTSCLAFLLIGKTHPMFPMSEFVLGPLPRPDDLEQRIDASSHVAPDDVGLGS